MSTLYELTEQARYLYNLLENEEIDNQTLEDTLESIGVNEKLESYTYVQKQIESDLEALRKEKERIEKKMKTCQNSIERVKSAVLEFMNVTGQKKAKAGTFDLSIGKSESVNITNLIDIPDEFLVYQPPKANKAEIKKKLKAGETVCGAELVENEYLRIR